MEHDYRKYVYDISEAAKEILEFTQGICLCTVQQIMSYL